MEIIAAVILFVLSTTTWRCSLSLAGQNYDYILFDGNASLSSELPRDVDFQRAIVGQRSGHLFVAGGHHLYQFSADLRLLHTVETSARCPTEDDEKQSVTSCSRHNAVRVWRLLPRQLNVDDDPDGPLLYCAGDDDTCALYSSRNLAPLSGGPLRLDNEEPLRLSGRVGAVDVVTVTAATRSDVVRTTVLSYVATSAHQTPSNGDPDASSVRRLLLRRLNNSNVFTTAADANDTLRITRRSTWRNFVFRFVAGFEYRDFVYLVTVQREYPSTPTSSLVVRLVRLCPSDVRFQSYTELRLSCSRLSGTSSGATAAQLSSMIDGDGQRHAALYVLFSDARTHASALCAYRMDEVVEKFVAAQRQCYLGHGDQLEWLDPTNGKCQQCQQCQRNVKLALNITEQFCGDALNGRGIGGRYPLEKLSRWEAGSLHGTSLVVSAQHNSTIAFIGTDHGHVLKFVRIEDIRAQTGLSPVLDIISRRRISVLGHIARLQESVPVNKALAVHVNSSLGRPQTPPGDVDLVDHVAVGSTGSEGTPARLPPTTGDRHKDGAINVEKGRYGPRRLCSDDDDDDELSGGADRWE